MTISLFRPIVQQCFQRTINSMIVRSKFTIDRSRVPVIKDEDIEEKFIKGTGPGGSKINKSASCVTLCHKPTGVVVRCQDSRLQNQNRVLARKLLVEKVDDFLNGDMSVSRQKLQIKINKKARAEYKKRKNQERRTAEKLERENDDEDDEDDGASYVDYSKTEKK